MRRYFIYARPQHPYYVFRHSDWKLIYKDTCERTARAVLRDLEKHHDYG